MWPLAVTALGDVDDIGDVSNVFMIVDGEPVRVHRFKDARPPKIDHDFDTPPKALIALAAVIAADGAKPGATWFQDTFSVAATSSFAASAIEEVGGRESWEIYRRAASAAMGHGTDRFIDDEDAMD